MLREEHLLSLLTPYTHFVFNNMCNITQTLCINLCVCCQHYTKDADGLCTRLIRPKLMEGTVAAQDEFFRSEWYTTVRNNICTQHNNTNDSEEGWLNKACFTGVFKGQLWLHTSWSICPTTPSLSFCYRVLMCVCVCRWMGSEQKRSETSAEYR